MVEKLNQQQIRDWIESSIRHYHSFRILSFCGFNKQGLSLLYLGLEKILKIYNYIVYNEEIRNYHNLFDLFRISKLCKQDFKIIFEISKNAKKNGYTEMRYDFNLVSSSFGLLQEELENEFSSLVKRTILNYNIIHHTHWIETFFESFTKLMIRNQDRKYKSHFVKRAFSNYDKFLRFDHV